jgi:hypothetical protein
MPRVEERLAKAQSMLESYLLRTGKTATRLGGYVIELRDGVLRVGPAPPDGWEQGELGFLGSCAGCTGINHK